MRERERERERERGRRERRGQEGGRERKGVTREREREREHILLKSLQITTAAATANIRDGPRRNKKLQHLL